MHYNSCLRIVVQGLNWMLVCETYKTVAVTGWFAAGIH